MLQKSQNAWLHQKIDNKKLGAVALISVSAPKDHLLASFMKMDNSTLIAIKVVLTSSPFEVLVLLLRFTHKTPTIKEMYPTIFITECSDIEINGFFFVI